MQVCEKYLANGKDVSEHLWLHVMWQMLRVYGVGGRLFKAVQSVHVNSRACVQVENDVSEQFPVNVGLRQGCVMSP